MTMAELYIRGEGRGRAGAGKGRGYRAGGTIKSNRLERNVKHKIAGDIINRCAQTISVCVCV